jgi:RND family efflux transporter MFP subunit
MTTRTKVIAGVSLLGILAVLTIRVVMGSNATQDKTTPVTPVAVEVTSVRQSTITEVVSGVGTVDAIRDVMVASETAGRVTKVLVRVGDHVRQGQILAVVDDELKAVAVEQAKAQALAAETNTKKSQRDYERAESLYKTRDISDAELEAYRLGYRSAEAQYQAALAGLTAAKKQLADTRIKSPIQGYIASKKIEVGEMVAPGMEIANIVDLSSVKVRLSIPEEQVVKLRLKQPATLRLDSSPNVKFTGAIYTIGSKSESPMGHTYPVEVIVENKSTGLLKAGMFARVEIIANKVVNALTIPKESLVNEDDIPMVFVAEKNIARERPVKLGVRSGESVQVLEGLKNGDLVISFGQKKLKDGTAVQIAGNAK